MTTREMFEKLGYTRNLSSGKLIYTKVLKGMHRYIEITFDLTKKEIELYDDHEAITINKALLKAIQQQLKELGWLEEEKQETNFEHYKDEILEECMVNLAVVKGRPTLCYKTNCNDCDFKINQIGCRKKVEDWLNKPYEKPKYKLTQFEYDLLSVHKDFKTYNQIANQIHLFKMHEKGYFKDIDIKIPIREILDNCEVSKN